MSQSGARYILTLVDDFNRTTWTYLMADKTQTVPLLTSFLNLTHNQFDKSIKTIISHNGSEICEPNLPTVIRNQRNCTLKTCPHTPQQNGVVERKHQHLLQIAKSLMFQASMPKRFWGHSILTVTHIVNKLLTPTLNWKSPFEILYDRKPGYASLKVFGCLCFATNTTPNKTKFEPRATKCVFLGYVFGQKAYKLYALDSKNPEMWFSMRLISPFKE